MQGLFGALGAALIAMGAVWILQATKVLGGAVSGERSFAIYGLIAMAVGVAVLLARPRRRSRAADRVAAGGDGGGDGGD